MSVKKCIIYATIIAALLVPCVLLADAGRFYNGICKYRGFYWFEDDKERKEKQIDATYQNPTAEEAVKSIDERREALDDARAQMIELAFRENVPASALRDAVIKYKKLEAKIFDGEISIFGAAEMANGVDAESASIDSI